MMKNEGMVELLLGGQPQEADGECKYFVLWINQSIEVRMQGKT